MFIIQMILVMLPLTVMTILLLIFCIGMIQLCDKLLAPAAAQLASAKKGLATALVDASACPIQWKQR